MAGVWRLLIGSAAMWAVIYAARFDNTIQNSIEIRVIVDRWAFESWTEKLETSSTEVQSTITDYVYSVFKDVNSIFKELMSSGINLDARVVSIEFITTEEITSDSPAGSGRMDSEEILDELRSWLVTKNYPQTDHTLLLTGLDLTSDRSTASTGKTYRNAMCNRDNSLSVAEARGLVMSMAYILGSSMSSEKDDRRCGNDYIMNFVHDLSQTSPNSFRFSSCFIRVIKGYLKKLHKRGDSCLSATNTNAPRVSAPALGQRYTPDEICKLTVSKSSYFCRSLYGDGGSFTYDSMCGVIYCETNDQCISVWASDGFVCGKNKRCSLGECKPSSVLSDVPDTCPQGDSPVGFNGHMCSQTVSAFHGDCYRKPFQRVCCGSCSSVVTNNTGCEYGDKSKRCAEFRDAPGLCGLLADDCCGTCSERS